MVAARSDVVKAVLTAVSSEEYFQPGCEHSEIEQHPGSVSHTAVCTAHFDKDVKLVFTLPTSSKNVYVTVTDGSTIAVQRILSAIEGAEQEFGIELGKVLQIDDPEMKARDLCAVIFLPPSTFNVLDHVPLDVEVGDATYRLLGVFFMSEKDNEIRKKQGHDALMDYWTAIGKDTISFGHS